MIGGDTGKSAAMKLREKRPLISVIVPVYNVEKYLARCVDSILQQTYDHFEIILVNDNSPDRSGEIIKKYAQADKRIIEVAHESNRGLFQARLSGVEAAHGDYIAFVDSDDYISVDWFRKLVQKAEETDSDIVVGEWCFDHDGISCTYLNLDPFRLNDYMLEGDDVLDSFMEQEGRCFSWTVVWNKLYKASLWKSAMPEFKRFSEEHGHMLMWEDIAFSAGLWARAARVTNVHGSNYFYFKHKNASTSISMNRDIRRNKKYVSDASSAIHFMETQLKATGAYARSRNHYLSWNARAASLLYHELVLTMRLKNFEDDIRQAFGQKSDFVERESFFYRTTTHLSQSFSWYEDIKRQICSAEIKYVSFDVFDTLISRPFLEPDGIFHLLSDKLNAGNSAYVDYCQIRKLAESNCRKKKRLESPFCEEVTLDEIYEEIRSITVLTPEEIQKAKELEITLELSLCKARKCGKELFDLALFAGKSIIICSDMYLPENVVKELLIRNGYSGWTGFYLSSSVKKAKYSGKLFTHYLKDMKITNPESVLHIGDNRDSDVISPQRAGMHAAHLDRAANIFRNDNPNIYGGELYQKAFAQNNRREDYALTLKDYPASQWILALAANRFFDNPFVSINRDSDFNCNPAYIGYAALGPHLLALARWIEQNAVQRHVGTVHFVARDGYLVKRAFDLIKRSPVRSNYIRLSRKAMVLADVDAPSDLYSLNRKLNIRTCSPGKLTGYLDPIIPKERKNRIEKIAGVHKFKMDVNFASETEFYTCLKLFIDEIVDFSLLPAYKEKLRDYFSQIIKPGDYLFDVGYSGRPEAALSNILGFPVGSFYIHTNSDIAEKRQRRYRAPNLCFYPYKPKITGVMREHLLMEPGPSTIAYTEVDGKLQPLFEEYKPDYCGKLMTSLVQENAIRFIEDYLSTFGNYPDSMVIPQDILSAAFEYYLHYSKPFDRELFASLPFEDDLSEGKKFHALDFWNNETAVRGLDSANADTAAYLAGEFRDMYMDGLFVKMYSKLNKVFPKGSGKREAVKRIASVFIK